MIHAQSSVIESNVLATNSRMTPAGAMGVSLTYDPTRLIDMHRILRRRNSAIITQLNNVVIHPFEYLESLFDRCEFFSTILLTLISNPND